MHRSNALSHVIGILGMLVAAAAFATDEPAAPATPSATTAPKQPLICRDRLRPGSHIAMRTCLTAAQWAAANIQIANTGVHDGTGPWGAVSTTGASVGMNAFTGR